MDHRAAADFLAGDYRPSGRGWPAPTGPHPDAGCRPPAAARALVVYDAVTGRVGAVVAPFTDMLSAEQYAIGNNFRSYDVVPATTPSRQ